MKQPCVSVILPSLNVEKYIRDCMDSVVRQTLTEIEIICVDAGSTDGTREVLEDYRQKDSRVCVLDSPMKSYGAQMNIGIRKARGEYIGLVDTDDRISPEMYERLYFEAVRNRLDFIRADYANYMTRDGEDILRPVALPDGAEIYQTVQNGAEHPEWINYPICVVSGIYRRDFLLEKEIFYHESPGASFQDNGFWVQVCIHARRARFLNEVHYFARRDNESSSVFDKQKVLTVYDEFAYIEDVLKNKIRCFAQNKEDFFLLCVKTYLWNFTRVAPEHYAVCLGRAKCDFERLYHEDHVEGVLLSEEQRETVSDILNDQTEDYFAIKKRDFTLLGTVREAAHCVLYGAGNIGKNALYYFMERGAYQRIDAFAVTRLEDAGEEIFGVKVYPLGEISARFGADCLVLVTAAEKHQPSMIKALEENGLHNYSIYER